MLSALGKYVNVGVSNRGCLGAGKQTNREDTDWLRARRPWIDSQQAVSPRPTYPFSCSVTAVGDPFLPGFVDAWHINGPFRLNWVYSVEWWDDSKWLIGNGTEGSSCALFQNAIPAFSWKDWGRLQRPVRSNDLRTENRSWDLSNTKHYTVGQNGWRVRLTTHSVKWRGPKWDKQRLHTPSLIT
jgi:hypothetical protein